jgi:hypothetical protein
VFCELDGEAGLIQVRCVASEGLSRFVDAAPNLCNKLYRSRTGVINLYYCWYKFLSRRIYAHHSV